ncbi:Type-1 restriction enzyme R protein [Mariniflexile rhizosphaerae]|uniref:type I restriction endonuclease subunit R n=1 Tax=unclassified Mariniflexile TaxID=2643887 RepID=UPI000CC8A080|nr:type I restriction endonuclease subunit R [Mariniflexile sp. TRM1-10]AXP82685.1 Type-1 restriction enzyme R protein [Mariniflexile sp. TRM1-10]PLB18911.1 MAG: Type I restriction-modification system, restriction subunit R [Flavobacteriaceae bacterium FS1-H7996/R]
MTKEATIEQATIDWLTDLKYIHKSGTTLPQNNHEVVLKDQLLGFIQKQYSELPKDMQALVVAEFTNNEGADLEHRNRTFHLKLTKGLEFTYEDNDGKEKAIHIYPIDFNTPKNNTFWAVNQFSITGKNKRRPDIIIYINGLPLIVFELKNWYDENTNIKEAHNQIEHYKKDIPLLFEYNALTIISDGNEAQHGMFSSSMEWFSAWKSMNGKDTVQEDDFQMHTLLFGLFPKDRLLNYIKNFVFHEDHNGTLIKKGAKYHQFFGVNFAVEAAKKSVRPFGDGRIGVIWHTQGSGKSISMAIYTGILRSLPELKNPTIVVQVDRSDLDMQLYENFVLAKDLVGDVQHADTTDDLRQLLSAGAGGVIFTTIEKFRLKQTTDEQLGELEHPTLSERENIIVMADEAHRTQYGLLDGFASNMRKALPNASFIGFTGTPVDSKDADTQEVFGNVIHTYDIKQSVDDNATVNIFYEPRLAKLHLWNENIDDDADEITEANEESGNLKWAAIEDAAGSEDRVNKIANDILNHFTNRTNTLKGKAMVVCMSRRNCVKMYNALTALEGCPEVAVVMTGNISKDPITWNDHIRTKDATEGLKKRFRKEEDPLKIVIVRDMWLTGFDAPCVHTMYVDKIMKGHNLMQAITRTNRVFKDKKNGVIVDYIGIGDNLKTATTKYTGSGGEGQPTIDIEQALELFLNQIDICKTFIPETIDYSQWRALRDAEKVLLVKQAVNAIIKYDEDSNNFMKAEKTLSGLLSIVKSQSAIQEFAVDVLFIQHISKAVRNAKSVKSSRSEQQERIKELISQSIDSEDIVDVFAMAGIEKPDISILDETFLLGTKKEKDGLALKIELIKNILKDEIKLRLHKNIKKYTSLKEELEKVIDRYHSNALDSYATIAELVERAKALQNDDDRVKELGLSEEELAFYDILAAKQDIIKEEGPIQNIVHAIVKAVKSNLQLDWTKKENAKAAIRLAVKKELRGKMSLAILNDILQEIMQQAEGQFSDWSA